MKNWLKNYINAQNDALLSVDVAAIERIALRLRQALERDQQLFTFGNGGSGANASHFATDLGKGASDKTGRRFRVTSLNDNMPWVTAIANDYNFEDVFVRQLENFARPGDCIITMSVSGNSPNIVKAVDWCRCTGLHSIALVGSARGRVAQLADEVVVVESTHYGRVEDAHMNICHMLCYAFMEAELRVEIGGTRAGEHEKL